MSSASRPNARPASSAFAALLAATALLSFAPVAVLAPTIGWPASLTEPAGVQLAAVARHAGPVTLGYGLYLLYSLLITPALLGLASTTFGSLARPLAATVAACAALSSLARAIGILRWLTVMPRLASAWVGAGSDDAARGQIELLFDALTRYGGGIGEVLGVSLLTAAAIACLCAGALATRAMPRRLAIPGLMVAASLAALASPAFSGPALVPVGVAVSVLSAWMIAAAVWMLRGRVVVEA